MGCPLMVMPMARPKETVAINTQVPDQSRACAAKMPPSVSASSASNPHHANTSMAQFAKQIRRRTSSMTPLERRTMWNGPATWCARGKRCRTRRGTVLRGQVSPSGSAPCTAVAVPNASERVFQQPATSLRSESPRRSRASVP